MILLKDGGRTALVTRINTDSIAAVWHGIPETMNDQQHANPIERGPL